MAPGGGGAGDLLPGGPGRAPGAGERAGGFALLLVVVSLLILTALAHATLFVARQELAVAASARDHLRARIAAESALDAAAAAWRPEWMATLAPGESSPAVRSGVLEGVGWEAGVLRLDREHFLLKGAGRLGIPPREVRAARILWALDPGARAAAFPAALVGALGVRVGAEGTVTGDALTASPGWHAPACDTLLPLVDTLFPVGAVAGVAVGPGGGWTVDAGGTLRGRPPGVVLDVAPLPGLGPLTVAALEEAAEVRVSGAVTPGPPPPGEACGPGPESWGDPDGGGGCGDDFPLLFSDGALRVAGGAGQGILVVRGDAELTAGALFHGLLLVEGELRVDEAALVRGFVVAGGGALVEGGGRVEASACPALRALAGSPVVGIPRAVPGGGPFLLP